MKLLHGGNIYDENLTGKSGEEQPVLDFSANINPLGMPGGVRRAVVDALEKAEHYPDPLCRKLRGALSEHFGLPEDCFLCGNGGADLIYRFARAVCPARVLLTAPTFAEYEEALKQVGSELVFYRMDEDLEVHEDILTQMDDTLDAMFLCNPNNPTGLLTGQELLLRILEKAEEQGILLFVDECFLDFTGQEAERSLLPHILSHEHLLVLRSFTKMYAMPGIRLGYIISRNREILERMAAAGQCWGVSVLASEAGIAALREQDYKRQALELVKKERAFLKKELEGLGLRVWDGQADYLFFRTAGITDLCDRLHFYGILIRPCSNYRGLDEACYRVAVKDRESNVRLIRALEQALK